MNPFGDQDPHGKPPRVPGRTIDPTAPVLSIPTPAAIREEIEALVLKDLLGPAGGPHEEVDEDRVSDRYLVGMLAPKNEERIAREGDDDLAAGCGDDGEDGHAESTATVGDSMFPSSLGFTFTVDAEVKALRLTARWGRYERTDSETLRNKAGGADRVWKRCPVEGVLEALPIAAGPIPAWSPDPEHRDVTVNGRIRRGDGDWIITVFLVNGQRKLDRNKNEAWLFQPELIADSPDGKPIFVRRRLGRDPARTDPAVFAEESEMEMIYRRHVEFAVGHGVAVHAETASPDPWRATRLITRCVPFHDVPQQTPPTADDPGFEALRDLVLDMKELAADVAAADLTARLEPLARAYADWITRERAKTEDPSERLQPYAQTARAALDRCEGALERIRAGIALLASDPHALEAFRFANRAMWLQRIHSVYAEARRRGEPADLRAIDVPVNRSWYPFQLAFILLNLPGTTDLHHPDRTHPTEATADLLWFPTGGGKTEAYLGLAAYVMAVRRLQGTIEGRPGDKGVAVLMRYTLRLLTLQQFQRASALMCACEEIRREALDRGDPRWGDEPFRIGLWVGQRATPNKTEDSAEAVERSRGGTGYRPTGSIGATGSPAQFTNCPWCGASIEIGRDIFVERVKSGRGRTLIYCGDPSGGCLFSGRRSPDEGLPVLVVDEEIYRLLPALLIATVDKFAQMPWAGPVQMLFGRVNGHCPRHGFRSPEIEDSDSHPKRGILPAVKATAHPCLRPPDLIIQDELHLISGPLGTLVGLYETAIDELASWVVGGRVVRPKVIASTATIRNAASQVRSLFLRRVEVFPPPGMDVECNFFSIRREPSDRDPGRRYIGICAPGKRLKAVLIRVYVAYLAAGQLLYERYAKAADPWMTLVGYFNSMRELGGMRRLVDDDIRTRLRNVERRGLARRRPPVIEELTSRKGSTDIPEVLDRLEIPFDPAAEERRKEQRKAGERPNQPQPLDVLLATNMVSVGVDVRRLGLMVVGGQPKATSEYIQATSRVGRRVPGLVCTVYNWARPRDLSHYERFEHYHSTFYEQVEMLSLTPFASRALDRGLTAILVALVRLQGETYNANRTAADVDAKHEYVRRACDVISERIARIRESKDAGEEVRAALQQRLDVWRARARGVLLGYKQKRDGVTVPLLHTPGNERWDTFTCLNSLREVEAPVGLILVDDGLTAATGGEG